MSSRDREVKGQSQQTSQSSGTKCAITDERMTTQSSSNASEVLPY